MNFPFDWLLLNKWYWIIVFGCFAVIIGPLITIYIILFLPSTIKAVMVFGIIIGWSIAGGYKDWVKTRRKEQKLQSTYMAFQSHPKEELKSS